MIIRSKFLVDAISFSKVQGKPFTRSDIYNKIQEIIKGIK
jgi:2-oxoglutarate ferredoxin oxidoreductase subunit alpha